MDRDAERRVDRRLVERAQQGDLEAFAELASFVADGMFAVAHRILRDADAASDALQAAVVEVWRDLPALRDPDRFEAWAYRIVVRRCYAERRRARRSIAAIELQSRDASTDDAQGAVALHDEIERAFRALSADQRAVLVLTYYRDMSIDEVATVIGVPAGTVKSRLHYARQAMRAAVEAADRTVQHQGRTA